MCAAVLLINSTQLSFSVKIVLAVMVDSVRIIMSQILAFVLGMSHMVPLNNNTGGASSTKAVLNLVSSFIRQYSDILTMRSDVNGILETSVVLVQLLAYVSGVSDMVVMSGGSQETVTILSHLSVFMQRYHAGTGPIAGCSVSPSSSTTTTTTTTTTRMDDLSSGSATVAVDLPGPSGYRSSSSVLTQLMFAPISPNSSTASSDLLVEVGSDTDTDNEDNCLVCKIKTSVVTFKPCLHKVVCVECSFEVESGRKYGHSVRAGGYVPRCVICRRVIETFER